MAYRPLADVLNGVSRFGRLTVLRDAPDVRTATRRIRRVAVACDCGKEFETELSSVVTGRSTSCGCARNEVCGAKIAAISRTHGMKSSPEYYVWTSMKQRCLNPKVRNFNQYGGRGITVCPRWNGSFEAFFEDMGPRPSDQHSIDRIDNDGSYEPSNCAWKVKADQDRNRRSNIMVSVDGVEMVLIDACAVLGVDYNRTRRRLKQGLSIDEIRRLEANGERAPRRYK